MVRVPEASAEGGTAQWQHGDCTRACGSEERASGIGMHAVRAFMHLRNRIASSVSVSCMHVWPVSDFGVALVINPSI